MSGGGSKTPPGPTSTRLLLVRMHLLSTMVATLGMCSTRRFMGVMPISLTTSVCSSVTLQAKMRRQSGWARMVLAVSAWFSIAAISSAVSPTLFWCAMFAWLRWGGVIELAGWGEETRTFPAPEVSSPGGFQPRTNRSNRKRTISYFPLRAACMSGVTPFLSVGSIKQPFSTRSCGVAGGGELGGEVRRVVDPG